jgi:hypothetical protein
MAGGKKLTRQSPTKAARSPGDKNVVVRGHLKFQVQGGSFKASNAARLERSNAKRADCHVDEGGHDSMLVVQS